jgi:hypothetical protein
VNPALGEILAPWRIPALIGAAGFGALWGSFLNVCIARIPRGMSVVSPPSHCFACGTRVLARDNIPILSYLLLRGRCAAAAGMPCRGQVLCGSPSYAGALVEAITAAWSCFRHQALVPSVGLRAWLDTQGTLAATALGECWVARYHRGRLLRLRPAPSWSCCDGKPSSTSTPSACLDRESPCPRWSAVQRRTG